DGDAREAPQALPVRLRRLPGHPEVGRHRLRLVERDTREPGEHAQDAEVRRRPFARRAQVMRRLLAGAASGTCAALVGSLAAVAGGLPANAVDSDRSFKLTLIENLASPPGILVLGSSRSRLAEPGFLRTLTGHSSFNAG